MEIKTKDQNGILIVRIVGQVDSTTGPVLNERLDTIVNEGHTHLALDLTDVPYMSSAGLRVLSITLKAVRNAPSQGNMCLAGLSKTVAHAFRISGFDQVFDIYATVPQAVQALDASRTSPQ